jgi:hypothetical protein
MFGTNVVLRRYFESVGLVRSGAYLDDLRSGVDSIVTEFGG